MTNADRVFRMGPLRPATRFLQSVYKKRPGRLIQNTVRMPLLLLTIQRNCDVCHCSLVPSGFGTSMLDRCGVRNIRFSKTIVLGTGSLRGRRTADDSED